MNRKNRFEAAINAVITLGCTGLLAGPSPADGHVVDQLAIGTDQIHNEISDNRIVMWATWSPGVRDVTLHDYLTGEDRTLEGIVSYRFEMNRQGDLFFPDDRQIYRYANDQLIELPFEGLISRGKITAAGDVVWLGRDDTVGTWGLFRYETSTGTLQDLSHLFLDSLKLW